MADTLKTSKLPFDIYVHVAVFSKDPLTSNVI